MRMDKKVLCRGAAPGAARKDSGARSSVGNYEQGALEATLNEYFE